MTVFVVFEKSTGNKCCRWYLFEDKKSAIKKRNELIASNLLYRFVVFYDNPDVWENLNEFESANYMALLNLGD